MATLSERLRGIAETSMFSVAPEYHEMADQALALEQDLAEALKRAEEADRWELLAYTAINLMDCIRADVDENGYVCDDCEGLVDALHAEVPCNPKYDFAPDILLARLKPTQGAQDV